MTYRQHHSVALDIQDDFEHVHHPRNELPLTMEDTTRRRYPHSEKTDLWHIDNGGDDDSKDVYSKAKAGFHTGRLGPVRRQQPPPSNMTEFIQQNSDLVPPVIYTLLSCWTRFYDIGKSDIVVWDEAHFGKFGSHYLKREFYFDVHPPLGKMLVGLAGLLSGYDGTFEFKSGEKYPDSVPFVTMRVMLALFGVAMVPLAWFTAKELLCPSSMLRLSAVGLTPRRPRMALHQPVHPPRFYATVLHIYYTTGWSIGCVCSVKWVGFFATALVGAYTIEDLWDKFGDLKMSMLDRLAHAHLHGLVQNSLLGAQPFGPRGRPNELALPSKPRRKRFCPKPARQVMLGSKVTLKNVGYGGGLLHSHVQTYPVGSQQQQVTCYHYKDDNNHWTFLPPWGSPDIDPNGELVPLKHAAVVRLQHTPTTRNLHSHTVTAPVTKSNYEVSCYGNTTVGDSHDHWVVEVVDDLHRGRREKVDRIHSLTTRLRFKHQSLGCYLRAANAVLPQWGFKQIEVSCVKENDESDTHTYWNVESHWNSRRKSLHSPPKLGSTLTNRRIVPPGNAKLYSSPFLRDFWHLNVAMMTSNNALVPDPDKEDILASKPTEWPFLHVGLRMCGWGDDQAKYYLLGHPIVWWSGSLALGLSLLATGVYLLRAQRKYVDFGPGEWDQFSYVTKLAFFGWVFHFMPFLIMGRVTYIHHYLPALWFSVLMVGHLFNHFVFAARIAERTKWIVFGAAVSVIVGVFWWFRGIAFGITGPIKDYWGLAWRKTWNIY
ncbi:protein O-mannosyl transferase [Rhizoctonia solani AG-1 IA]|uniref:Dolichyl-phosphate-mannose--protein mannosyltransferase n=1 Tax=Thanatephorus cucumeris (strain AG1-IA) TaxID=983506 RepID=L8WPK5_THACA|nr:protein O-mannosyl transferase [Rhizoctonia solani AG-1 IA]